MMIANVNVIHVICEYVIIVSFTMKLWLRKWENNRKENEKKERKKQG
jgi:hypothetical protein